MDHDHSHHDHHHAADAVTAATTTAASAHNHHHGDHSMHGAQENVTGSVVNHAVHHMMEMSVSKAKFHAHKSKELFTFLVPRRLRRSDSL